MMQRLPLVFSAAMTVLTILSAYATFGSGSTGLGLPICLLITAVGIITSERATSGLAYIPRVQLREIQGAIALVVVFLTILLAAVFNVLPMALKGWEVVVGATCGFTFLLSSQRSFLMHAALSAFLLLTSLLFRPLVGSAVLYGLLFVGLNAVLFRRELEEEVLRRKLTGSGTYWSVALPVSAGVLAAMLLLFHKLGDDTGPTYDDLARGNPATSDGTGRGRLDQAMPDHLKSTAANPWATSPRDPLQSESETGVAFDRDLKFGDAAERAEGLYHPETVVMYVQLKSVAGEVIKADHLPLYWKAAALALYDGRGWTADRTSAHLFQDGSDGRQDRWITFDNLDDPDLIDQRIIASPLTDRSLFMLYPVKAIEAPAVYMDSEGSFERDRRHEGRFRYRAFSAPVSPNEVTLGRAVPGPLESRYLDIPDSFSNDAKVLEWVREIGGDGSSAHRKATRLLDRLAGFEYTLAPRLPLGQDPTVAFLRAGRGYCQHFASAMALMLRKMGIPARVAVGFSRGEWEESPQVWVVRRKHAHAWVEVNYAGLGWVPYDPAGRPVGQWIVAGPRTSPTPTAAPVEPPPVVAKRENPPPPTPADPVPTTNPQPTSTATPPPTKSKRPTPTPQPSMAPAPTIPPAVPARAQPEFDRMFEATQNKEAVKPRETPKEARDRAAARVDDKSSVAGWMVLVRDGTGRVVRDVFLVFAGLVILGLIARVVVRAVRRKKRGAPQTGPGFSWPWKRKSDTVRMPVSTDPSPRGRVIHSYLSFLGAMAGRGVVRPVGVTPVEFLDSLRQPTPAAMDLTDLFVKARYDRGDVTAEEGRQAEEHYRKITSPQSPPGTA